MVAWEKQLEERSVPAWRSRYVAYARLKRKLDQLKMSRGQPGEAKGIPPRAITGYVIERPISDTDDCGDTGRPSKPEQDSALDEALLEETERRKRGEEEFLNAVESELRRVSAWYQEMVTVLERSVLALAFPQSAVGSNSVASALASTADASERVPDLHLQAVQLTDFAMLNAEALRKIVKKMDKQCGTKHQKEFVAKLQRSELADPPGSDSPIGPCSGERARQCRRRLEQLVSPERLQELRNRAMSVSNGGAFSELRFQPLRLAASALVAALAGLLARHLLPAEEDRAQRCVVLVFFTVAMWVSEAAPFEATAMLVAPMAVLLEVLEGPKQEQAKQLLASVFNDSLYLVLCGFVISSVFSRCQLDCRAAHRLQMLLGHRPFLFMLSIMLLGVGLSALVSNVTAPLLLLEVLKPLLRDLPTDSRYSRAVLLGLAFSCNVGGMMTPISSPQNVASLQALVQYGGSITWGQWLLVSVPFCIVTVVLAWGLLFLIYSMDCSPEEAARDAEAAAAGEPPGPRIPAVIFEKEEMTLPKIVALIGASATLLAFACNQVADLFGGTSSVALLAVSLALGTGTITRQTFNSYSWHLLFLIGGGSALGLSVKESGLLDILTELARREFSGDPRLLIVELVVVLVGATTFVSHTVAALVLMPLVAELGGSVGKQGLAVLLGAFSCSAACALPMTSFPNVNSLLASDDHGKSWLGVKHFLKAGIPMTLLTGVIIVTWGYWLASRVVL